VLIEAGVNINATDFLGGTALTRASRNGHVEIVQLLLKCCPDLEAIDVIAWKDLLEDMDASQKSFVSDDIEPVGCTALWLAARHGHYEIAMALIEAGADVNKGDYYAETPFMCSTGCPALVRDLIAAGADVNAIGGDHDGTPLCYAARQGNVESITILLEAGADATIQDGCEKTPLLHLNPSAYEAVPMLVAAGNSVNKLDSAGHTVLSKLVDSAPCLTKADAILVLFCYEIGINEPAGERGVTLSVAETCKKPVKRKLQLACTQDHDGGMVGTQDASSLQNSSSM
jgi:hypothetical protein